MSDILYKGNIQSQLTYFLDTLLLQSKVFECDIASSQGAMQIAAAVCLPVTHETDRGYFETDDGLVLSLSPKLLHLHFYCF